jgi:hypothetical protein
MRDGMGENPFAPPATRDLDGTASSATTGAVVSEEAMRELVEGGRWAWRLAQLMIVSIVLGFAGVLASIARARVRQVSDLVPSIVVVVLGTGLSALFFVVLRRYAAAARRLAGGEREAAFQVIDAQAGYFKLSAVLVIGGVALGVLVFVAATLYWKALGDF